MKNTFFRYLTFVLFLSLGLTACNDFEDENYDFSNSSPAYVELSSGAPVDAIAGEEVPVTARVRVALQSVVTVNYEVSGDLTATGTIEIPAGMTSGSSVITLPTDPDTGFAVVKITAVDNGLTLGRGTAEDALSALEFAVNWTP